MIHVFIVLLLLFGAVYRATGFFTAAMIISGVFLSSSFIHMVVKNDDSVNADVIIMLILFVLSVVTKSSFA